MPLDEASVAGIAQTLADREQYARSIGLWNIRHAIEEGRVAPDFLAAIFPIVAGMLNQEGPEVDVAGCLVLLDRDRAIPILLSPECLCLDNPQLEKVIDALNSAHCPIPHSVLRPLMEQLEPLTGQYPRDSQYAAAVVAYGLNPDPDTESKLRSLLESPIHHVAESAAWALVEMNGLGSLWWDICTIVEQRAFDSLSEPQQRYYAVNSCHFDINNGGLRQCFSNSSGDRYDLAIDGLRAMNAPERVEILEAARTVFGPEGPPQERGVRRSIVFNFSSQQKEFLSGLDDRYYASKENVEMRLSVYAVDHKEAFIRP